MSGPPVWYRQCSLIIQAYLLTCHVRPTGMVQTMSYYNSSLSPYLPSPAHRYGTDNVLLSFCHVWPASIVRTMSYGNSGLSPYLPCLAHQYSMEYMHIRLSWPVCSIQDSLFNTILALPLLRLIWPARTNWIQSPFRPARFNGLQYYSGRGPLARMVRQI